VDIAKFLNELPSDLVEKGKKIIATVKAIADKEIQSAPDSDSGAESLERAFYAKLAYKICVEMLVLSKIKNRNAIKVQLRTILCIVFDVAVF